MVQIWKYSLLFILVAVLSNIASSQTYEEFRKKRQEELNDLKLQQESEIAKLSSEFDNYVKQADKEFTDYLQKEWEAYQIFQGIKVPERPKPTAIPNYKPGIDKIPVRKIKVQESSIQNYQAVIKPVLPVIQKAESENFLKSKANIDFYGASLSFQFDEVFARSETRNINEQGIAKWWSASSETNYNLLVNELLSTKNKLSLNDWAYYKLVDKTALQIARKDKNKACLMTWFLMTRSGYKMKVAFSENSIYLLMPSINELYGKSYLLIDNERFYFVEDIKSNTFQSYDFDFPGSDRLMDFNILQPLNIGGDVYEKQITFNYNNETYTIPVSLNINTLYFLKDYPIVNLDVFFNGAISEVTKQSLSDGLIPILNKMSQEEAINFLLTMVQKSFNYKTDQEQFNREKFFFPEEVFYYPASDCEDRSALFSYLVKQLLRIKVIGLEYDEHVATAVLIDDKVFGDYFSYHDEKYIMADPTYVNAPLGMTMPQYKNAEARVIPTLNNAYSTNLTNGYWDLTNNWGGQRGSNLTDAIIDSHGNCYLTGYYSRDVSYGKVNWKPEEGKRQAFIVKYNKNKALEWAKNLVSSDLSTGFSLVLDDKENPVIAGSFNGNLKTDSYYLSSKNNHEDIFVAAFNKNGEELWLKKSGLDTINYDQFFNYVIKLGKEGKNLKTQLYFENEVNTSKGIYYADHTFTIVGGINNTTGFNTTQPASFNAGNEFSKIDFLKEESDALIANNTNKSIAGLLAVINLIKSSGMVIPGKEAQDALDKYNPGFQSSSPTIYENIGKVTFMKNNDGVIVVQTNNNKAVLFDKIKIRNGATIKISSLQSGDEQVDILSGIEVGKMFVWFNLNYVRMIKDNGDLLFDYDTDHTQKTVNMEDDILN